METNPYHAPSADLFPSGSDSDEVGVAIIDQLRRTKPWVRFMSIIMWIGVALLGIAGIGIAVSASNVYSRLSTSGAFGNGMMTGIGLTYGVFALIYIYPAVKLWAYGTWIGRLSQSASSHDLTRALNEQRAFWKFCGIMISILIVLYVGILAIALSTTISAGNRLR